MEVQYLLKFQAMHLSATLLSGTLTKPYYRTRFMEIHTVSYLWVPKDSLMVKIKNGERLSLSLAHGHRGTVFRIRIMEISMATVHHSTILFTFPLMQRSVA